MWLSVGFAGLVMAGYALLSGLIKINIKDKDEVDEDSGELADVSTIQFHDEYEDQEK
jgi:hypothetical protein